jgi:hypothetical protein
MFSQLEALFWISAAGSVVGLGRRDDVRAGVLRRRHRFRAEGDGGR